jgi:membrane-bound lytic murein transglycosylase D
MTDRRRVHLALAAALVLLATAGCQRLGMEELPPPAPPPATAETEAPRPAPAPAALPERRPAAGPVPEAVVDVEGLDVILHSRAVEDRVIRERTAFWIDFWTGRSRDYFERYLERMGQYGPMVDRKLELREMPASLRYLPIVESGYHHGVTSRAGATGLWQLMPPTARGLGLMVDGVVDDRRDPVEATRAALDYLTELHDRFDSWLLALAAYNAGPGRVGGILQRYAPDSSVPGDERFLRIRPHLPAETREFVPRFLAAATLASDPERHGFRAVDVSDPFLFDEVRVTDATSMDVVALAAGVDEEEIRRLNPQYMRGFTPAGRERAVRVPVGTGERFASNYALIPPEHRVSFMEHVIASGETLSHVARRYGVTVAALTSANARVDPRRLQIGQRITVPTGGGGAAGARAALARAGALADEEGAVADVTAADARAADAAGNQATGNVATNVAGNPGAAAAGRTPPAQAAGPSDDGAGARGADEPAAVRHVVAPGESLWSIGRRHGVRVDDLRRWNGLDEGDVLHPGRELVVGAGALTHRVQRGDTWIGIARRYGVTAAELARANARTTRDVIRIGEELRVP